LGEKLSAIEGTSSADKSEYAPIGSESSSVNIKSKYNLNQKRCGRKRRKLYGRNGAKHSVSFTLLISALFAVSIFASKMYKNYYFYSTQQQHYSPVGSTGGGSYLDNVDTIQVAREAAAADALAQSRVARSSSNDDCPNQVAWEDRVTYPKEMFYLGDENGWLSTCGQRGFVPLYLIGALYMFLALAIVCDDFFVPSLEVIIDKTHLPEDVAGATFMAAGGSAPELFTSLCGIMFSDSVDVGIGTIVGSAVFNVLFVIAICAFGTYFGPTDKTSLELTWYPFTRDVTFYSIGLALLIGFFSDSKIYLFEAAILFAWYIFYCMFMIVNERFQTWAESKVSKLKSKIQPKSSAANSPTPDAQGGDEKKQATPTKTLEDNPDEHEEKGSTPDDKEKRSMSPEETNGEAGGDGGGDDDEDEDDGPLDLSWPSDKKWYQKILHLISLPIKVLLMVTVPDCRRGVPDGESGKIDKEGDFFWWWGHSLFFITFIMSILWIGVYSFFMVWWVERIGFLLEIESSIMGLTLLAAGTSIPDLITSYLVASKGFGDMALSSSIGSNLFDICVGLPIPWMIYLAIETSIKVTVDSTGLICYILMLFAMLIAVFICILVMQWRLNLFMGIAMMILYIIFLIFAILIGQDVLPCILD